MKTLPALVALLSLGLAPGALAMSATLSAELDQKSATILTQSEAYQRLQRDIKTTMAMEKSSGPSAEATGRLVKAMADMKVSIGELLGVLTSHESELRPEDAHFDAFVASLRSRSQELADGIDELEHPPLRGLLPPSAMIRSR